MLALLLTPLVVLVASGEPPPPPDGPLSSLPYTAGLEPAFMDRTVDPCADFYAYACGGWQRSHPIPPDEASWDVYSKLGDEIRRYLWGLLQAVARPNRDRDRVERQLGDYFAACMDEAAIDARGATPLAPALEKLSALRDRAGLSRWLAEQHLFASGSELLFGLGSERDLKDPSKVIASLEPGGLGLPDRDDYLDKDAKSVALRARYREHIEKLLSLVGDPPAQAATTADLVLRLETELARATLTRVERRDPHKTFHPAALKDLAALAPALDWKAYLSVAGIPTVGRIDVSEPQFFTAASRLLQREPLDTIKRYLRWRLVDAQAWRLSRSLDQEDFDFHRHFLRGIERQQPRWKRCVRTTSGDLGELLGQLFVKKTFPPELKEAARRMIEAIQGEMAKAIEGLSWMSGTTKAQALAKLQRMENKIGYPDRFRDYSNVAISRDDFYGNLVSAIDFENARQLAKIGKPVDRSEWHRAPQTLDGSYNDTLNAMEFSAGILQPPLYDPRMDAAPNYGDTGGMMGHELIHGFDDNGRRFDAKGALRDWWTKRDSEEFARRASCISDQYSRYVAVDDVHVNGKLTLGEDIADLGGLVLAYRAWKTVTTGEPLAPRDGLSPEQRFFVGYAQWACGNVRPEMARVWARTDPHSPNRYRVNGVVVNMPEFGEAFSCKVGQPMVTARKDVCQVW